MPTENHKNLIVEENAGLVTLTMNRPEKRNALSTAMMSDLVAALSETGKRADARAVIIAGNGPAFSAGHDLGELKDRNLEFYRYEFDLCAQLMQTIQSIPQPVIARVHAIATAAGCQLAATCDLVVAGESATFATPGVKIGLFCSTPMVALTRAVGRKHAMEMLLTGRPINARLASEWGLVNHVVPDADLVVETNKLAMQIVEASPLTIGIGKQAFYNQIEKEQADAYNYTKEVMSQNATTRDAQEGISAFLQKRKPTWSGK
jgi:enoyl-CoA hydratase/carnithine racemase